jgi:hypothetical protein
MSTKHKFSFAQKLPLYYFLFVALFILIYFMVMGMVDPSSFRDAAVADAAQQEAHVKRICVSPPPCVQNSFVCWFRSWFIAEKCRDIPTITPLPSMSEEPSASPTAVPIKTLRPNPSFNPIPFTPKPSGPPVFCTQEMILCPDGSYGARDPNNSCKPKCPTVPKYSCAPRPPCSTTKSGLEVCLQQDLSIVDPCVYPDTQ